MYIFIVGPQEQVFEFPDALIESNPKLVQGLSQLDGKRTRTRNKRTQKVTVKHTYTLPDFPTYEFEQFELFLYGNDFLWDENIANLFAQMGFTNDMGYPLDYWKVKLQDNWIRNNFYSLELYNPEVKSPSLLIERGPYVGLEKITHLLQEPLISFERRQNSLEALRKLKRYMPLGIDKLVIAGGALITYLIGAPRNVPDVDVFVVTKDQKRAQELVLESIENHGMSKSTLIPYAGLGQSLGLEYDKVIPNLGEVREMDNATPASIAISANSITADSGIYKFQYILRLYECPSEVVHGFDLDASGLLFDGEDVWATKRAVYAIKNKINFFDFDRMSESYGYRLAKYASRGFKVWIPDFQLSKVNRQKFGEIKEVFERDVEGEREANRLYEPNLLIEKAPYFIPGTADQLMLKSEAPVKEIIERRNPVDLILFATYFRYLPKLGISNYSKGGNATDSGDDYSAGDGFVIFFGDYMDYIFQNPEDPEGTGLPNDIMRITGLPKTPVWKVQNPMEQLTGTFNPTTIADLNEWYNGAILYNNN